MPGELPTIDFAKIDFPSDSVTLKDVRSLGDAAFTRHGSDLDVMYEREKEWAAFGFARGLGDAGAIGRAVAGIITWNEAVDGPCNVAQEINNERDRLAASYTFFGIAESLEHAHLLIDRLEQAGAAEAVPAGVVDDLRLPPRGATRDR